MFPGRRLPRYTYAQYVALELESPNKHEFLDGDIIAMAGGTAQHAALQARMISALEAAIGERPCLTYTSDLRIYVEAHDFATFPDGSVVCGELAQHPPSLTSTALNPVVLVEVTSDSSEDYDRTTKLDAYRTIPTLRDYVVVSHRERKITVHYRTERGDWATRIGITSGRVRVESLGADLDVDHIYRGIAIA